MYHFSDLTVSTVAVQRPSVHDSRTVCSPTWKVGAAVTSLVVHMVSSYVVGRASYSGPPTLLAKMPAPGQWSRRAGVYYMSLPRNHALLVELMGRRLRQVVPRLAGSAPMSLMAPSSASSPPCYCTASAPCPSSALFRMRREPRHSRSVSTGAASPLRRARSLATARYQLPVLTTLTSTGGLLIAAIGLDLLAIKQRWSASSCLHLHRLHAAYFFGQRGGPPTFPRDDARPGGAAETKAAGFHFKIEKSSCSRRCVL